MSKGPNKPREERIVEIPLPGKHVEAGYKGPPKGEGKPQSLPPEPPKPPSDQKSNES